MECKSPTERNPLTLAIQKNLATYQQRNTGYEKMFYYNQILVAMCGSQAKYSPTYAKPYQYTQWIDPYQYSIEDIQTKYGRSRKQEILIAVIFERSRLLRGSFTTTGGYTQTQQAEDPVKLLQMRLAKGEITPEQYQASLKMLQGA
jgi:hypothetical protein